MAMQTRNPRLVQKLLGHTNLETTAIYMDLVGDEKWRCSDPLVVTTVWMHASKRCTRSHDFRDVQWTEGSL